MKRLYEKKYNPMTEIDESLFNELWDIYNDAADKGFSQSIPFQGEPEGAGDFYNAIKYNNGVFAAFKTHRMQNDMASQLLDENGKLKSFQKWEADTRDIRDHHVRQWLETEYNTAVKRAHMAADWQQFEHEKDILPNLEWIKSTSVTPGEDHRVFWGTILPIDDPFWNEHRPGDRWNCKCGLRSTDKPIKRPPKTNNPIDKPADGLNGNPGVTAKIFSDSHPYIKNAYEGAKKVVAIYAPELMNQISRKEVRSHFQQELKGKNIELKIGNVNLEKISITYQDVKKITGKPHKFNFERNMSIYFLPELLKSAKYIGSSYDRKPNVRGHGEINMWHYYECKINGEYSYIIVSETQKGKKNVHSIQDKDHFDKSKIEVEP